MQLNSKFSASCSNNQEETLANAVGENVDLDNLFAFLSEVHADGGKNAMLEEIENQMTELVSGFDEEIQLATREKGYIGINFNNILSNSSFQCSFSLKVIGKFVEVAKDDEDLPLPSPPPNLESPESSLSDANVQFGLPSLPEPTERPPPPPTILQDEPIYEAIQPRNHPSNFVEVVFLLYNQFNN